jgi:hypothetical protein
LRDLADERRYFLLLVLGNHHRTSGDRPMIGRLLIIIVVVLALCASTAFAQGAAPGSVINPASVSAGSSTITTGNGLSGNGSSGSPAILQTPVTVANGGRQCGAPVIFASLPGSPTNGEQCTITDAVACTIGTGPVTVGGGGVVCPLFYNGTSWYPIGGFTYGNATIPNAALVTPPLTAASTLDTTKLSAAAMPSGVTGSPALTGTNFLSIPDAALVTAPITACSGDINAACTQVVSGAHIANTTIPNAALVTAALTAASTLNAANLSGAIPTAVTGSPALSNANFTGSPIAGIVQANLLAVYPMTNCDGSTISTSTLPDCSGNGSNGTLVNSPAPTAQGLGFVAASSQSVTLPTPLAANMVTVMICADYSIANFQLANAANPSQTTWSALLGSAAIANVDFALGPPGGSANKTEWIFPYIIANTAGTNSLFIESPPNPSCLTFVLDSTTDKAYINSHQITITNGVSGTLSKRGSSTMSLGATPGSSPTSYFQGLIYYVGFWSSALTQAQIAQNVAAVEAQRVARGIQNPIIPTSTTANNLFIEGDSISTTVVGVTAWHVAVAPTDTYANHYNVSRAGSTLSGVRSPGHLGTGAAIDALCNPNVRNTDIIFLGTNDLCPTSGGATAAATIAVLQAEALTRKRACPNMKVGVATMLDRTGCDAIHDSYNSLIRSTWPQYADFIVDFASNANLGADSASANTTYFQADAIHPTATGQALMTTIANNAINLLDQNLPSLCTGVVSVTTGTLTNGNSCRGRIAAGASNVLTPGYVCANGVACSWTDITTVNGANTTAFSTSSITFSATNADVVDYNCGCR